MRDVGAFQAQPQHAPPAPASFPDAEAARCTPRLPCNTGLPFGTPDAPT